MNVSVRDLKAKLSRYLREAHAGQDVVVTSRGQPVARLPINLPAGHFVLDHGYGAHPPDEYYVIESRNPKVHGRCCALVRRVSGMNWRS
jgi:antitoxin Phd_YefM of type II toxin-antitoxin system